VRDEEASEGEVGAHLLPQSRVIALPKGPQAPILPPGSAVLAIYPGTTTFYRATVRADTSSPPYPTTDTRHPNPIVPTQPTAAGEVRIVATRLAGCRRACISVDFES
jgi:hypothetical protein